MLERVRAHHARPVYLVLLLPNLANKIIIFRLLWKGNWFVQEKSCKILTDIIR